MHKLRQHQADGELVATSSDKTTYQTADGTLFAHRTDDIFAMVDGRVGTKNGTVVFVKDSEGTDVPTYWFEDAVDPTS